MPRAASHGRGIRSMYARAMSTPRLALLASPADEAQSALAAMTRMHGVHAPQDADVVVALGGDGFMLQTLHRHGALGKPVYGMKLGTVGFLMNQFRDADDLHERIAAAEPAVLHPLEMLAQTESGATVGSLAYNEVSLLRQTRQAAGNDDAERVDASRGVAHDDLSNVRSGRSASYGPTRKRNRSRPDVARASREILDG